MVVVLGLLLLTLEELLLVLLELLLALLELVPWFASFGGPTWVLVVAVVEVVVVHH